MFDMNPKLRAALIGAGIGGTITFLLCVLIGSFVSWDWSGNISAWNAFNRGLIVLFVLIGTGIGAGVGSETK